MADEKNLEYRVKPQFAGRKLILIKVGERIVNFGSLGAFVHNTPETKTSISQKVLIRKAEQSDFKAVMARGKNKAFELYDPIEEKKLLAEIKAEEEKILADMETKKDDLIEAGVIDAPAVLKPELTTKTGGSKTDNNNNNRNA